MPSSGSQPNKTKATKIATYTEATKKRKCRTQPRRTDPSAGTSSNGTVRPAGKNLQGFVESLNIS